MASQLSDGAWAPFVGQVWQTVTGDEVLELRVAEVSIQPGSGKALWVQAGGRFYEPHRATSPTTADRVLANPGPGLYLWPPAGSTLLWDPEALGGGGGAPTGAQYIVGALDPTLTAERLLTTTASVSWDLGTAGVVRANVPNNAITDAILRDSAARSVIGRGVATTGDPADIVAGADGDALRRAGGVVAFGHLPASSSSIAAIGSPAWDDLQSAHDVSRSAGQLDGGAITDAGGGTINVAAGEGYIRGADDDTSTLYAFTWPAASALAIPDGAIRYVVVEYNGGSPAVALYSSETYNYRDAWPLGVVAREGSVIYVGDAPHTAGRVAGRLARRNVEVDGRSRANAVGGLILSETGTRNVAVTAGVTWWRGVRDAFAGLDTATAGSFDTYHGYSAGWVRTAGATQTPNDNFDNGTAVLAALGTNNYATRWFYLGPAGGIAMLYGRADHNQLSQARAEGPPATVPPRLQVGAILLGRVIYRKNNASAADLSSAFSQVFTPSAATEHGDLAGLADDDHPQYVLRSEANAIGGHAGLDASARVGTVHLGSGSASSSTYLRGDQTWATVAGGVSDGDKGDITVSGSGATWTIDADVVTAFARTLLDDVDAATARATLGAGTGNGTVTSVGATAPIASSGGATPTVSLNDNGITYAKLQDATAGFVVLCKATTGSGDYGEVALGSDRLLGRVASGNVASVQVQTAHLADAGVTYAKIQNVTDVRLLGRSAGGAGPPQELTVGSGLSLAAGELTATGGGGGGLSHPQIMSRLSMRF